MNFRYLFPAVMLADQFLVEELESLGFRTKAADLGYAVLYAINDYGSKSVPMPLR